MREEGIAKGMIVIINDDTGESTFLEAEPLHLNKAGYQLFLSGKGLIGARVSKDLSLDVNYFSTENFVISADVALGTGDGTKTTFTGSAGSYTYPNSVKVFAGTNQVATDDGNGNITGDGVTGTVDYDTGDISVTFSTAPANGTVIKATVTKDKC